MAKTYIRCWLTFKNDTQTEYECDPYFLKSNKIQGEVGGDELTRLTIDRLNHWVANYERYCRKEDLVVLGRHLYALAFGTPKIKSAFEDSFKFFQDRKTAGEDVGLKLFLVFHAEVDVMKTLPWEFLYLPIGRDDGRFLAGQETELILTRFVPEKKLPFQVDEGKEKLRILVVLSKPAEADPVDADKLIAKLKTLPYVNMRLLPDPEKPTIRPTRANLEAEINTFDPHIMHFIGHGMEGKLALIKDDAAIQAQKDNNEVLKAQGKQPLKIVEAEWVNSTVMRGFFDQKRPRVVFLHACKGESTLYLEGSVKSFTSMARDLAYNTNIPAVIAMQYEIENAVAETFAMRFYQEIRDGRDIDEAVTIARNELGKTPFQPDLNTQRQAWDDRSFGTPVIYLQNEQRIIQAPPPEEKEEGGQGETIIEFHKEPCPYPKCDGMVVFGKKFCNTCHRRIMVCPNCGKRMIAEENPFCDECGYDGTKTTGTAVVTAAVAASSPTG